MAYDTRTKIEDFGGMTLRAAAIELTDGDLAIGDDLTVTGDLSVGATIELGHATDTTLARSAAGKVTIEGVEVLTQTSTITGITNKTFVAPVLGAATGTSLVLSGDLTVNGVTNLGNAAGDTVTITGSVVIPLASVPSYADQAAAAAALDPGQLFRFDTTGALGIALT